MSPRPRPRPTRQHPAAPAERRHCPVPHPGRLKPALAGHRRRPQPRLGQISRLLCLSQLRPPADFRSAMGSAGPTTSFGPPPGPRHQARGALPRQPSPGGWPCGGHLRSKHAERRRRVPAQHPWWRTRRRRRQGPVHSRRRRREHPTSPTRDSRRCGIAGSDHDRWLAGAVPCRGGPSRNPKSERGEAMVYRAARAGGPGRWTSRSRRRAGASFVLLLLLIGLGLWLAGCGGGPPAAARARATLPARWVRFLHVPGVVDLTGPRGDGQLTVAAAGRLFLLGTSGQPVPFARGSGGYTTAVGPEPYIAMPTGKPATGLGCSFGKDATYALEPNGSPGVISIDKQGQARRFASLPGVRPDGIAFDDVGRFGYRLLVTATARGGTTVFGVDCAGRVTTIASHAPRVEGGIAVAPLSFGSFGGDLVAPDETTGRVWAIGPGGKTRLIARSPLPAAATSEWKAPPSSRPASAGTGRRTWPIAAHRATAIPAPTASCACQGQS